MNEGTQKAGGLRARGRRIAAALGLMPLWLAFLDWRTARTAGDVPLTDEEGVPMPPARLMSRVVGHADWRFFLESGRQSLAVFRDAVDRNGGDFAGAGAILDFGCGCGRLARHLPQLTRAEIFGVDYNPELAGWCRRHLKGDFRRNGLNPPLPFGDGQFDIVYLYSVFTHQRLATQNAWLGELRRVLAPGGLALITIHDEDHPAGPHVGLTRERVIAERFIVHNDAAEGSNFMATFQSRDCLRRQAGDAGFEVLEMTSGLENSLSQTLAVLRRPYEGARARADR